MGLAYLPTLIPKKNQPNKHKHTIYTYQSHGSYGPMRTNPSLGTNFPQPLTQTPGTCTTTFAQTLRRLRVPLPFRAGWGGPAVVVWGRFLDVLGRKSLGGGNSNIFDVHPKLWGRFPIWRAYFSKGLKPPTRLGSMVRKSPMSPTDTWDIIGVNDPLILTNLWS